MQITKTVSVKKSLIMATLLLIALNALLSSVSAPPTVGANVNVTNNAYNQNEPMIAINPTDHNKLVVGFNDYRSGGPRAGWSWSDVGGTTWTYGGNLLPSGYGSSGDPVVAFDNTGTAYFAGMAWNWVVDHAEDGSIFFAKSSDGGHTFGTPQIIVAGSGTATYYDKPWMFVNPANNHIYLAWTKILNRGSPTETSTIWFTRSTDFGVTFSSPIQVSTLTLATFPRSHGAQIAAGSGSSVYVSWFTWHQGTLDSNSDGVVDLGWVPPEIWISKSTDGGATFGANHPVTSKPYSYPAIFPSLGADPSSGRIYIAYVDRPTFPGDLDVYVTTSTSVSGPWTSTRVNDDTLGNGRDQFWPSLDVAPNGRVDVIFYDERDQNNQYGVYYTSSSDGGTTWESNTKVTDLVSGFSWGSYFAGDYISVASEDEKAQAAWMDWRLGGFNLEIFTATLTMPVAGIPPVASFTESAHTVLVGTPITFDPTGSSDSDGTIVLYEWDWDSDGVYDHSTATPDIVSHTYTVSGTYTVTLRVTDNDGLTDTATDTKTITPEGFVIPEYPLGTIMASAAMFIALVGYLAIPKFRKKQIKIHS